MLTKAKATAIRHLHEKKHRDARRLFLVEGEKSVSELLTSDFSIDSLFITSSFAQHHKKALSTLNIEYSVVEQDELENISTLGSNDSALAVVHWREDTALSAANNEIILALDTIQDPGNLGTIIRTADWYGISKIICSKNSADFYNSKTIAASMGSFARVRVWYTDLEATLPRLGLPVLGAYLEGTSVHAAVFPRGGVLLVGNESRGISDTLSSCVHTKITIPSYGNAESLNAAIATAIILDNWKRSAH